MSHLLIWGNAYAQVFRDGNGRVFSLYPILPDKMEADRGGHGQLFYFDGLVGYSPMGFMLFLRLLKI